MIGVFGRYILTKSGQNPEMVLGVAGENVLSMLLENVMPATIIGIYIAAVLSAVMSTVDSLLVVASSAISRDFYQQVFRPEIDKKKLMLFSKKATFILALFALSIALIVSFLSPNRTVFWFVIFGWSGIAATFCPTLILSLFWKKYTEKGAIASMISGFMSVPVFKFLFPNIKGVGIYFEKLDVMLPSFLVSLFFGYFVSRLDNKNRDNSIK
tara:strand:- start:406 stop:1041 length:636 start_codon:yes stop_codon:yes gene_type:complete